MAALEPAEGLHMDRVPAEVRGRSLARQDGRALMAFRAFVVVDPQTGPRLWQRTARTALDGFEQGLAASPAEDVGLRLLAGTEGARHGLVAFCRTLVERTAPDVHMVAFLLDGLHLVGAVIGGGRVYQHHRGRTTRLSPRDVAPEGLLRADVRAFRADLPASSLLFAGTETAFTAQAIERSAELLDTRRVREDALARTLTGPAEDAGTGAAVVVLRP